MNLETSKYSTNRGFILYSELSYGQVNSVHAHRICYMSDIWYLLLSSLWVMFVISLCRIEKQAEQEEVEYQAQRRRFLAEIRREKERLTEEETRMNKELEETKQSLSRENAKVIGRLKQEHQETMETCTRKHQAGGIL